MQATLGTDDFDDLIEYVAGNAAWDFPDKSDADQDATESARHAWRAQIASLDCALLSLLGEADLVEHGIEEALDTALAFSLRARSITRRQAPAQLALRAGLAARARILWTQTTPAQRRSYYLAGVGLETGQQLDVHAEVLNQHLYDANFGILTGDDQSAIEAVTRFAPIALDIQAFAPKRVRQAGRKSWPDGSRACRW